MRGAFDALRASPTAMIILLGTVFLVGFSAFLLGHSNGRDEGYSNSEDYNLDEPEQMHTEEPEKSVNGLEGYGSDGVQIIINNTNWYPDWVEDWAERKLRQGGFEVKQQSKDRYIINLHKGPSSTEKINKFEAEQYALRTGYFEANGKKYEMSGSRTRRTLTVRKIYSDEAEFIDFYPVMTKQMEEFFSEYHKANPKE